MKLFILIILFFSFLSLAHENPLKVHDETSYNYMSEKEFEKFQLDFNIKTKRQYLEVYRELSDIDLPPASQLSKIYPNWKGFEEESVSKSTPKWVEKEIKKIQLIEKEGFETVDVTEEFGESESANTESESTNTEEKINKNKSIKNKVTKSSNVVNIQKHIDQTKKNVVRKQNNKNPEFHNHESFIKVMINHPVSTTLQYKELRKKNHNVIDGKRLPAHPDTFYENWPGWGKFLVKDDSAPFKQVEVFIQRNHIQNDLQYEEFRKLSPLFNKKKLPVDPKSSYPSKWTSYEDILSRSDYFYLEELKEFVIKKNIQTVRQYHEVQNENSTSDGKKMPSNPNTFYVKWISWNDLLVEKTKTNKYTSIEDIREMAEEEDIRTVKQYKERRKKNRTFNGKILPSNPSHFYKNWPDWSNVLVKPEYASIEDIREMALKENIQTVKQYHERRKKNDIFNGKILPYNPSIFYKNWPSWGEVLVKPEYASIEDIREMAEKEGIQTSAIP